MQHQPSRRRTGGRILTVTAVLSMVLVTLTTGISSAQAVSTQIPATCVGADAKTLDTLNLAKALIGSNTVAVKLLASAADIPPKAAIGDQINAKFKWGGTLDQALIDKAAGLGLSLAVSNIKAEMLVKGPSDIASFSTTAPNTTVSPKAGQPAVLPLGTPGGTITTTGGGIITYRVGPVTLTAALSLSGQNFLLNLKCTPDGSNLIAKTTVRDPDAPVFTPEVVSLDATPGGTASVDLLGNVISEGKTPLIPSSLEIVENPSAGTASIVDGKFTFTAPTAPGTYSTTVQICGEPKPDSGIPGVSEVQKLELGANWSANGILAPRPVAFTLKVGDQETPLIWTAEHNLLPNVISMPLADGSPTPDNWAPENKAGLINAYALQTHYKAPTAATIQSMLEGLPNVGAGNVAVTPLKENANNPNKVTGFDITFQGALAEQDVPAVSLGQWYTVPPQELLDRIGEAVANLAGSLGGDDDGAAADPNAFDFNKAAGINDNDTATQKASKADAYMGQQILNSIQTGKAIDQEVWDGWVGVRVIDPLMDAVPSIISFINSLFPNKPIASTVTPGEAPTPPAPLCAQGIIDVTVGGTEVEATNAAQPGPAVLGENDERGVGFTG